MRWEALFADLEAQLALDEQLNDAAEAAELARAEQAGIALTRRLAAHVGSPLVVHLMQSLGQDHAIRGVLVDAAPQWLLVQEEGRGQVLVPQSAVAAVGGLTRRVAVVPVVQARLSIGHALRALARDRAGVRVLLLGGTVVDGTIDRVGSDHLDLALHGMGEARRAHQVQGVLAVPFAAIQVVRAPGNDYRG